MAQIAACLLHSESMIWACTLDSEIDVSSTSRLDGETEKHDMMSYCTETVLDI